MNQIKVADIPKDISQISGCKILVVVSEYNEDITSQQVNVVNATLREASISENNIEIIYVPGVFEIGLAIKWMLDKTSYDAVIALGCVIRGETEHFNQIVSSCTRSIERLMLDASVPIADGVLAVNSKEQAEARSNRAQEAAIAAIRMILLKRQM